MGDRAMVANKKKIVALLALAAGGLLVFSALSKRGRASAAEPTQPTLPAQRQQVPKLIAAPCKNRRYAADALSAAVCASARGSSGKQDGLCDSSTG